MSGQEIIIFVMRLHNSAAFSFIYDELSMQFFFFVDLVEMQFFFFVDLVEISLHLFCCVCFIVPCFTLLFATCCFFISISH